MSYLACCCGSKSSDSSDRQEGDNHYYQPLDMNQSPRDDNELLLISSATSSLVNLTLTETALVVTRRKKSTKDIHSTIDFEKSSSVETIPYQQVLAANKSVRSSDGPNSLHLSLAAIVTKKKKKKGKSTQGAARLWKLQGQVHELDHDKEQREQGSCRVEDWCRILMDRTYKEGVKPGRRLRVIINKHGGKGEAYVIWKNIVQPIFEAAGCSVTEQGRNHNYKEFDALVTISGDGIVHQILNGLASRQDAVHALQSTPIVPIPAGSGNALQLNLEGLQRASDCAWAALAAVKGSIIPLDLCSVSQDGERYYSFLSQAFGLMADLDLGTEHLRWMGDARFVFGYVRGALTKRTYPVELSLKIVETSKKALAESYNADLKSRSGATTTSPTESAHEDTSEQSLGTLPSLKFGSESCDLPSDVSSPRDDLPMELSPGWHTLRTPVQYIYAGKLPFVSRDAMLFPPASAQNGLIDVTVMGPTSRVEALSGLDGAAEGKTFWNKNIRYYRCEAYRLTPLAATSKNKTAQKQQKREGTNTQTNGYISIDGESVPFSPFQVEVHRGLARCIALNGQFFGTTMAESP